MSTQEDTGAGPFDRLPFPDSKSIAVKLLAPVPQEFEGEGILVGRMQSPFTESDVRRRFGGGEFELSYTEPGHRNPTQTYRLIIDGEPRELEITPYLSSSKRRKRRDDDGESNMPPWAVALWQEVRAMRGGRRPSDPLANAMQLLLQAKQLGLLGDRSGSEYREAYKAAFEDAKQMLADNSQPPSIEVAVAQAIPEFLDVFRNRGPKVTPRRAIAHNPTNGKAPTATAPPAVVVSSGDATAAAATVTARPPLPPELAALPKWAHRAAVELARAQKRNDDPNFTASWMERYLPGELVDNLHAMQPAAVVELVMQQLGPVCRHLGQELDRGFVTAVIAALLEGDVPQPAGDVVGAVRVDPDEDDLDDGDDDDDVDDGDDDDDVDDGDDDDDDDLENVQPGGAIVAGMA